MFCTILWSITLSLKYMFLRLFKTNIILFSGVNCLAYDEAIIAQQDRIQQEVRSKKCLHIFRIIPCIVKEKYIRTVVPALKSSTRAVLTATTSDVMQRLSISHELFTHRSVENANKPPTQHLQMYSSYSHRDSKTQNKPRKYPSDRQMIMVGSKI